jgi:hypothetical protein
MDDKSSIPSIPGNMSSDSSGNRLVFNNPAL